MFSSSRQRESDRRSTTIGGVPLNWCCGNVGGRVSNRSSPFRALRLWTTAQGLGCPRRQQPETQIFSAPLGPMSFREGDKLAIFLACSKATMAFSGGIVGEASRQCARSPGLAFAFWRRLADGDRPESKHVVRPQTKPREPARARSDTRRAIGAQSIPLMACVYAAPIGWWRLSGSRLRKPSAWKAE